MLLSCDTQESLKPLKGQVFVKLYGGIQSEEGFDLLELQDGGFILVGSTTSFSDGDEDIFLVRTDANGNEIWSKNIDRGTDEIGRSIILSNDGNSVVIIGEKTTSNGKNDIFLVKINLNGELLNDAQYGELGSSETGVDVIQAQEGGYLLAGNNIDSGSIYFVEVNEDFSIKPNRERKNLGFQGQDNSIASVMVYDQENYLGFGTTTGGEPGVNVDTDNFFLFTIGIEGNTIPNPLPFGGMDDEVGMSFAKAPGGYIMAGYKINGSDERPFVLMVNNNLTHQWERTYNELTGTSSRAVSIIPNEDNGYTVLLESMRSQVGSELGLMKIGSQGDIEWEHYYGSEGNDTSGQIIQLENDYYVAIGSFDFAVNNNEDLFKIGLVKTNPQGELIPVE